MKIVTMLPDMDDTALENLIDNARRLTGQGTSMQQEQASLVLSHAEAEQARRKSAGIVKPVVVRLKTAAAKVAKAPRVRASKKAVAA